MDLYKSVMFGLAVCFIVIQALIVNYLVRLESTGCECAMDWRRRYIIFFLILTIVYAFMTFFLEPQDIPILQTSMLVMGILNVIFTLQYVHMMKKQKCNCSESIYRDILSIVAIFNAFMYAFLFIMIIFMLYVMASYAKTMKGKPFPSRAQISIKPLKNTTKGISKLFA